MEQNGQGQHGREHAERGPLAGAGSPGSGGERIAGEFRPLGKPVGIVSAAEGLLRVPGRILFEMRSGACAPLAWSLVALAGLLLLGLGPVSWVFSQSTESVAFMGGLHLVFWGIALQCGLRFLAGAAGFLHGRGRHLLVWSVVFTLVSLQMTTTLRPIVGTADRFFAVEKKFFLAHWAETIDAASPQREARTRR